MWDDPIMLECQRLASLQTAELERSTKMVTRADLPRLRGEWQAAIRAKVAEGLSPDRAISAAAREHPQLRAELLAAANSPT